MIASLTSVSPLESVSLSKLPNLRHGFFTRAGGVSTGIYNALNCGLGSHDSRDAVLENRSRVAVHLGGNQLLTCHQIHSAIAVTVDRPWAACDQPKADAVVTRTRGIVLGALAADCAPILFADPHAGVIAAAHAGWKGALGGILEATVAAMVQSGADRRNILATVGPCISATAYEVGPEFESAFLTVNAGHAGFFKRAEPNARPHFDLPGFVLAQLRATGIAHVEDLAVCTYANEQRFFSYRRTTHRREADYGRQVSAIVLT